MHSQSGIGWQFVMFLPPEYRQTNTTMKNFFINLVIFYVVLSLVVGLLTLLTGIHSNPIFRLLVASFLAYFRPVYNR